MPQSDEETLVLKASNDSEDESQSGSSSDEIVSINELIDDNKQEDEQPKEPQKDEKKPNKKKLIIIGAVAFVAVLIIIVLIVVLLKKDKKPTQAQEIIQQVEQSYKTQDFKASKIDDMINKANQLYEKGNKFEALKIYENIATYNQALSSYNLGVSQMKQGRCDEAIASFSKAIQDRENTSVSAINAAVCSLELGNMQNFNYYIELANSFLQNESNSPLYSYYFALINYYKGNYIEALHALNHPSSEHYKDKYAYLSAKILTALGRDDEAISKLIGIKEFDTNIVLAQLYAKKADFSKARDHLAKATKNTTQIDLIKMTAAMIDLKTGYYKDAAGFIKEVYDINKSMPSSFYKIKATLNPEIFDINLAQSHFHDDMFFDKVRRYETIFYFAPYKVFDAKQTMSQIRKGGVSLFLDDTDGANKYLGAGLNVSEINIKLSGAVADALNYKLKEANAQFKKLSQAYPEHSILQYNLALTYAQLGNFSLAAKHFLSSYHLDQSNYLAGVFYAITSDINGNLSPKFISEIMENLESDKNLQPSNIYTVLLGLINQNQAVMIRYLEEPKDETTLNLAFDTIIARIAGFSDVMKAKSQKLLEYLPNDIVANILNFIANNNSNSSIKQYANNIQIYFKSRSLDEMAFYHGANIIKKQYIKLLQISGLLFYERDKIKKELQDAPENVNLLQTLAYIQIFTNEFKESFAVYNRLIDEFKLDDANTLFLASVAATGANSHNNAIALLELTSQTDPSAIENRVALGFLYQQIDNINAAIIQYNKVGNTEHKNEFYDFTLINK
ncbi:tetratricopeptide repeat protein [Campylobacter mucosalis]|uniref:tetratricopeptide repeat protein n=1 Tax=Campylobacter mucosalis TaxID=202 RepID=UPI0014704C31